jgi:cytochrome P450
MGPGGSGEAQQQPSEARSLDSFCKSLKSEVSISGYNSSRRKLFTGLNCEIQAHLEEHRHIPPTSPYFDPNRRAWVLTRYADVYAALRETALCQAAEDGEVASPEENTRSHSSLYEAVQADIVRMSSQEWRTQMAGTMHSFLHPATTGGSVDLVRTVIQPWSATVVVNLCGTGLRDVARTTELAGRLFYKQLPAGRNLRDRVQRKWLSRRYRKTEEELERMVQSKQLSISKSMFVGFTQTLPSFLAKAWLALLQNPDQAAVLRDKPESMVNAVEELLRYAGIVHTISRHAASDVSLGDTLIRKGDRVVLNFASANYDPAKFDQPERLNVLRHTAGQLGLGTGLHACVGAILVRTAVAAVTPAFLATYPTLAPGVAPTWTSDSTLSWPLVLPARLAKKT